MPARTDHDRRDAQSAVRGTVSMHLQPYIRRMIEYAYAIVEKEAAENDGSDPVDWIAVGQAAAYAALQHYGVTLPDRAADLIGSALSASHDPPQITQGPGL